MTRKAGEHLRTKALDSCFDIIKSHQQRMSWSPPLEIEPAIVDCWAETLQLIHEFILHTRDAKLTSYGNFAAN